ncbi:hypothetical protein P7K49_012232 [Saguinus oedipus]|uniref:Uncharacterized protein n=1 Tax=Saguinus oedipus TaxID=9490 RepID=A0ABQ9VTM1_SAGOE|nr:hypothetical protein P7K49_012232 [Saguinus oedipus]
MALRPGAPQTWRCLLTGLVALTLCPNAEPPKAVPCSSHHTSTLTPPATAHCTGHGWDSLPLKCSPTLSVQKLNPCASSLLATTAGWDPSSSRQRQGCQSVREENGPSAGQGGLQTSSGSSIGGADWSLPQLSSLGMAGTPTTPIPAHHSHQGERPSTDPHGTW